MLAFKETEKFLIEKYKFDNIFIINFKADKDWFKFFYLNQSNYYFYKLLNRFLKIKNKKILDDLKIIINKNQIIKDIYIDIIINNKPIYHILKILITLGANINKDLLDIKYNKNNIDYINNAIYELDKFNNDNFIDNVINDLVDKSGYELDKLNSYNLIIEAYYAQKINRFIKYYYNDKYRLSKFRYNLEKKKYLDLINI